MNERGHYGSPRVGQAPPATATVYVEREPSSIGVWILGTIAVGGAVLWARHQSRQIEQLYKTADLPQQSFASSLRQGAGASLHSFAERAGASLHSLAERARPKRSEPKTIEPKRSEPKSSEPKSSKPKRSAP